MFVWIRLLVFGVVVAWAGAPMLEDNSPFVLWWWRTFGWRGLVDLPLSLLPLGAVILLWFVLVWGLTAPHLWRWLRSGQVRGPFAFSVPMKVGWPTSRYRRRRVRGVP